jgi:hypothetical protein
MAFCLVPRLAEKFKQAILSGEINPDELANMAPKARHDFLANLLGEENAGPVNALFESKLLLKNQQAGFIRWAETYIHSKQIKRDIISRIQRLDKVLNPADKENFLEDLASTQLGTKITYQEAEKITDLSKNIDDAKSLMDSAPRREVGAQPTKGELAYGTAIVEMQNYLKDLKAHADKFSLAEFKKNPVSSIGKGISHLAGEAKSINASLDDSAIFRQGWKVLWTNPKIWTKNALKSFTDIIRTVGKEDVMNALNADIVSRPNYDLMTKAKLAIGISEEAFPTSLPEKIPVAGRVYKASQDAYTAFVHKTRADVFDKYIQIAKETGVDLTKEELESIGKLVNSLTGRGNLGPVEPIGNTLNNILFSPRLWKSHLDVLLQPVTGAGGSNFVRKQAALNLLKMISGGAAVLVTANAVKPGSVEKDPRSADFGKIKIGNTRFDVSGGIAGTVTLMARLATMSSKSSTTGEVNKLNARDKKGKPKFGAQTGTDVVLDFFSNKLSPAAAVIRDLTRGHDFDGKKPTVGSVAKQLFVPLPIKTYEELVNTPDSANIILSLIAESLGISTNTYTKK